MGNPNSSLTSEFQSVLYYKFTFRKEYSKDELAVFLNKSPDTIQRYVSGRLPVSADTARDIIRFVLGKNPQDTELLEFFCPIGIIPVSSSQKALTKDEREKRELDLAVSLGKAIETIEKAYDDGRIEKNEYREIHPKLNEIRKIATELDLRIQREAK